MPVLGLPDVSLLGAVTITPLSVVRLGVGMLSVPVSRAALNAAASAVHGRTSAILSGGRLLGMMAGPGLVGVALASGSTMAAVHEAMLVAWPYLVIGVPAARPLPCAPDRG